MLFAVCELRFVAGIACHDATHKQFLVGHDAKTKAALAADCHRSARFSNIARRKAYLRRPARANSHSVEPGSTKHANLRPQRTPVVPGHCRRRSADSARLRADPGRLLAGDSGRRRQPILPAPRRRPASHRTRGLAELAWRHRDLRRFYPHPTACQKHTPCPRGALRANAAPQAARGVAGRTDRAALQQERHPGPVPQPGLLWQLRLRP